MKKTVLALFVFALCGIGLPSCGNDDPDIEIPYLTLGQSVLYFSAEGGTQYNTLVTNVESSQINVSSDKEWVSVDYTPSKIYCNVSENPGASRQATVSVSIKNYPGVNASLIIQQEGNHSVGRYEVTYSLQVTQDLIDLLDAQCHYRDEKGELQSFIVGAPNLGEDCFHNFPHRIRL